MANDFVPPEWSCWAGCRGPWPRLIRWLHKRGFRPATTYAHKKCQEELERYEMEMVLSACWATGKTVIGTVGDNGEMMIQELGDAKDNRCGT